MGIREKVKTSIAFRSEEQVRKKIKKKKQISHIFSHIFSSQNYSLRSPNGECGMHTISGVENCLRMLSSHLK